MDDMEPGTSGGAPPKEDVSLPKATVYKMLDELLPPDTRLSQECRELFVECCTEFINLVSSESLDVSEKDGKKIIGPEHVIKAVETLGFTQYVGGLKETLAEHVTESKEGARAKLKATKKKQSNAMSTEDAIKAQEALFAAARAQMNS